MAVSSRSIPFHARMAAHVSLNEARLAEAQGLRINMSKAAEEGLSCAVAEMRTQHWRDANQAALDSCNAYVEQHGLPLAKYRGF